MPRFAANISMLYNDLPFKERFAAAGKAGFKAVEFLFPYDHAPDVLAETAQAARVDVVLFNMPPGDWEAGERGIACHPGRVQEFQDNVAKAVSYARSLQCPRIHAMAGIRPANVSHDDAIATLEANLRFAAREMARFDLTLTVEPINSYDMPGFVLNRSAEALEVIRRTEAPNIKLQYDIYHMQRMEGDLAHTITEQLANIGHMQLADNPGRHEPGTGEINYDFLFSVIDRLGYEGWIGCEYKPATDTTTGLAWLERYV